MNWENLKDKIYIWEGGWLDLYVLDINERNWFDWVNYVNEKFKISWFNGRTQKDEDQINFSVIQEYWSGNTELISTATIYLTESIQIKAHFFDNSEFENDLDPREFNNLEDHNALMNYLLNISTIMKKEVILTPENCRDIVLISANGEKVNISTDFEPSNWPLKMKE